MRKLYPCLLTIAATAILFIVIYSPFQTSEQKVLSTTDVRNQAFQTINYTAHSVELIPEDTASSSVYFPLDELHNQYHYTLSIPSLSINAPVLLTGIASDGRMAVPENFKEVGLFNGGAKPGEQGTAIMGAHVDNGGSVPGIFKKLSFIKQGDSVVVKDVQGHTFTYKVTELRVYDKDARADEVFADVHDGKSRLNIITCYGTWLPKQGTYSDRLVVFTQLVSSS